MGGTGKSIPYVHILSIYYINLYKTWMEGWAHLPLQQSAEEACQGINLLALAGEELKAFRTQYPNRSVHIRPVAAPAFVSTGPPLVKNTI
jgi:hypothetical protein